MEKNPKTFSINMNNKSTIVCAKKMKECLVSVGILKSCHQEISTIIDNTTLIIIQLDKGKHNNNKKVKSVNNKTTRISV